MANYDWREFQDRSWRERFPRDVLGSEGLRFADSLQSALDRTIALRHVQRAGFTSQTTSAFRPCVFISHRQKDVGEAERIAYLACMEGFDYWLDIYDPNLGAITGGGAPAGTTGALAIATIIEMGLLNSTQVIAVMTPNTPGSAWVPYEYGRVKDPVPNSTQAACWVHKSAMGPLPEYLLLGEIHRTESQILTWLRSELVRMGVANPMPGMWTRPVPAHL